MKRPFPTFFVGALDAGRVRSPAWLTVTSDALQFRYLLLPWTGPRIDRADVKVLFVVRHNHFMGNTDHVTARFMPDPSDAPKTRIGELFGNYDPRGKLVALFSVRALAGIATVLREAGWPVGQ